MERDFAKMSVRLPYMDVAKGILILMVVWSHFALMERVCYGVDNKYVIAFTNIKITWISFFMPAFFFITGYCSSFDKKIVLFLTKGFSTIVLPSIIVSVITQCVDYIHMGMSLTWSGKTIIKSVLLNAGNEWFLPSLFIGRILCFLGIRLTKSLMMQGIIMIVICIGGVYLYNSTPGLYNFWFFKHAFMVTFFIWLGIVFKRVTLTIKKQMAFAVGYILLFVSLYFLHIHIPYITNKTALSFSELPLLLALSFTGIMLILGLSKVVTRYNVCHSVDILKYIGKNSIVIYLLHFGFYRIYIYMFLDVLRNENFVQSWLVICLILLLNILSCCIMAWVLNKRYFRWILGK